MQKLINNNVNELRLPRHVKIVYVVKFPADPHFDLMNIFILLQNMSLTMKLR